MKRKLALLLAFILMMQISVLGVTAADTNLTEDLKLPSESETVVKPSSTETTIQLDNINMDTMKSFNENMTSPNKKNLFSNSSRTYSMSATSNAAAETSTLKNNTPGDALFIQLNNLHTQFISAEGEQDWYFTQVESRMKVTPFLQQPDNNEVDYDMKFYKLVQTTTSASLELVMESAYPVATGLPEQRSEVLDPGYYFMQVVPFKGYDASKPYIFGISGVSTYDAGEPNDHVSQSLALGNSFDYNGTLDNAIDSDWFYYIVSQDDQVVSFNLDNISNEGDYKFALYLYKGGSLNFVRTFDQDTAYSFALPVNEYLIRVFPNGTGTDTNYRFSMKNRSKVKSVSVNSITTNDGKGGNVSYQYGRHWRVYTSMTATGYAFDAKGRTVPNAPVTITFLNPTSTKPTPQTAQGVTDANGKYTITLSLPHASGELTYDNWVSMHYFDLAGLTVASEDANKTLVIYHFAYSVYQPH